VSGRWLRKLIYASQVYIGRSPINETCKDCWRQHYFDFHAPPELWEQVWDGSTWHVPGWGGPHPSASLCLSCFDRRAHAKGIAYWDRVVVLGWEAWQVVDFVDRRRDPQTVKRLGAVVRGAPD
jgi:hypothetical protein